MRDKRPVDELSVEELERILAIKKREERQRRSDKMRRKGRVVNGTPAEPPTPTVAAPPKVNVPKENNSPQPPPAPKPQSKRPIAQSAYVQDTTPRFEGEVTYIVDDDASPNPDERKVWRKFANRLLLLVEVAAVFALVYMVFGLFGAIEILDRETAEAQRVAEMQRLTAVPTIAPTPQLRLDQIVLPGGHTPPTSDGGPQFNYSEIPSHLQMAVRAQLSQPVVSRPQPTSETALSLSIPKLNIDHVIVQGTDWEALRLGIGQVQNGVNPTDPTGNLVLAAHNDIYGEIFRHLDQLQPGDQFQVRTNSRVFTYEITGWDIYRPTEVHVMNNRDGATATLISCYPYQVSTERIVVFANRLDDV